jgi:hypothetical protein
MFLIILSIATNSPSINEVTTLIGIYSLIFLTFVAFYWPLDHSSDIYGLLIGFGIALTIRLLLLDVNPIASTDYHRNLMFGNIFALGYDPYTTTGIEIYELIQNGQIELIVPYTSSWDTHAYDYPSMAMWLFWVIIKISNLLSYDPFLTGKVIFNLFDIGSAYFIYKIVNTHLNWHDIASKRTSLIFLLNPFSVSQVGLEGQFESLPLFTFLISLYFFLKIRPFGNDEFSNRGYVYIGTFFFVISILCKYYSLICLPALLIIIRDWKLILRHLIALITFSFYLSIPFIIAGPYITNFLNFQVDRNANPLISTIPVVLGYYVELSFWAYLLCGAVIVLAFINRDEKTFALGLMAFFLTYFLFKNNSLFPWYLIWLLNAYPLLRITDSYLEVTFWFILIFIYLAIWIPNVSYLLFAIVIIGIGFLSTHILFPIKR